VLHHRLRSRDITSLVLEWCGIKDMSPGKRNMGATTGVLPDTVWDELYEQMRSKVLSMLHNMLHRRLSRDITTRILERYRESSNTRQI
jgi:hypothetical protein